MVRATSVGTGQSSGDYARSLVLIQTNDHTSDSSVKKILATLTPSISGSRDIRNKSLQPTPFSRFPQRQTMISCPEILKATYDQLIGENIAEFGPMKGSSEPVDTVSSLDRDYKQNNNYSGNSTLIDDQISIGPDGYSVNELSVATEQASNSGNRFLFDFQSHGTYQGSNVDLVQVSVSFPITTKKKGNENFDESKSITNNIPKIHGKI